MGAIFCYPIFNIADTLPKTDHHWKILKLAVKNCEAEFWNFRRFQKSFSKLFFHVFTCTWLFGMFWKVHYVNTGLGRAFNHKELNRYFPRGNVTHDLNYILSTWWRIIIWANQKAGFRTCFILETGCNPQASFSSLVAFSWEVRNSEASRTIAEIFL